MHMSEIAGRGVYAVPGEKVVCKNGHPICEISTVAYNGQPFLPSAFLCNWAQPEPKPGTSSVGCRQCGSPFHQGLALHFAEGYRIVPEDESKSPTGHNGRMRAGLGSPMNYEAA